MYKFPVKSFKKRKNNVILFMKQFDNETRWSEFNQTMKTKVGKFSKNLNFEDSSWRISWDFLWTLILVIRSPERN